MGELGLIVAFAALVPFRFSSPPKAWTPEYAFHAALFRARQRRRHHRHLQTLQRAFSRMARRRRSTTKPNYNYGPIKFTSTIALFWRHRGLPGRPDRGVAARLSRAEFRPAVDHASGASRPLHTSAVIFRLRRQRAAGDVRSIVMQRTSRARMAGDLAVVRGARLQLLHPDRGHGLSARHHPRP